MTIVMKERDRHLKIIEWSDFLSLRLGALAGKKVSRRGAPVPSAGATPVRSSGPTGQAGQAKTPRKMT